MMMIPITMSSSSRVNGRLGSRELMLMCLGDFFMRASLTHAAEVRDIVVGSIDAVHAGADQDEAVLVVSRGRGRLRRAARQHVVAEVGISVVGVVVLSRRSLRRR